MVLYTMSGQGSALAIITVDSPQIIFAIDPVIALLDFFTSAFTASESAPAPEENVAEVNVAEPKTQQAALDFRIDLHDVSVSVLENDSDPETQSIQLSVKQILLSQQVYLSPTRIICLLTWYSRESWLSL